MSAASSSAFGVGSEVQLHHYAGWIGGPASIDWCEENWVYSKYVAEFWNTLTSIPVFLGGVYLLYSAIRLRHDWLNGAYGFMLAVTGLGSMLFHGTLTFLGQSLDELPMIWCSLILSLAMTSRSPLVTFAHAAWGVFLTYGYLFGSANLHFDMFIFVYVLTVARLVVLCFLRARQAGNVAWLLFLAAAGTYTFGFLVFWIPTEILWCRRIQWMQGHALFHVTSVIGSFSAGLLVCFIDPHGPASRHPRLSFGLLPFVEPGALQKKQQGSLSILLRRWWRQATKRNK